MHCPMGNIMWLMTLTQWLSEQHGRSAALAAHLRLPPSFVAKMKAGVKAVPIAHMAAIERFTAGAVTRRDLRPDDAHLIWPELAESEPKPTPAPAHQARVAINSEAIEAAHGY